jgi:DNA (cytosine-5)-methyltransferase 1
VITVGSLFAGIGGIELGLERAGGFRTVWQVEKDEFARKVLAKHWPGVRRHDDVRTFPAGDPADWQCGLICGGFPCQDISGSGNKIGLGGSRSGLWAEFARIIREIRPRHVVVENVADLRHRGLGRVLGDLAGMGFDAEWATLPAAAFGVPQRRFRLFIVAHADGRGQQRGEERDGIDPHPFGRIDPDGLAVAERAATAAPSRVRRMGGRVPRGVDRPRVAACGNAVVPAVAEWIGRMILAREQHMEANP